MPHFGALMVIAIGLAAAGPAHAQDVQTIWSCKDKDGRTSMTNLKEDTAGKDCRVIQQQRVNVVPAQKPAAAKSPAGFPKESPADRASAKSKQRDTLERELSQEESMLVDAKRKLAEQESVRSGDEKNYAKVLERLRPYKDAVEVHEKNVAALKRELGNLR